MARTFTPNRAHLGGPYANDAGFMYFGSGNPDSGYSSMKDTKNQFELSIKGVYRQGEDIEAVYNPKKKLFTIDVPDGFQVVDPEHGVPVANANRYAFNVNWAFGDINSETVNLKKLSMKIDIDPREGKTKYLELKAVRDESGNIDFIDKKTKAVVVNNAAEKSEDGGWSTADSFNFKFVEAAIENHMAKVTKNADYDYTPTAGDQFDWIMKGPGDAHLHARFNLFDNPADDLIV